MNYPAFNSHTRQKVLEKLASHPTTYDAVIIGGGIVGAGLLRELAIRGIKALLVEKSDFASGTSSKSSKLIHGGLRYLEMGDFHLVFEALAERHWLLQTHPHLVSPVEFNVPIYEKKWAPPGARGTALLGLGLWLYDGLSLFKTPFFHGRHNKQEVLSLFPHMRDQGLKGSYYYSDAMMMDDEIVLENLLDAKRRGAEALNYVQAKEVSAKNADGTYHVHLENTFDRSSSFSVQAKQVIVCVGPWTEKFGKHVPGGAERKLKPSKGIHIIIPWSRFPVNQCLVMYAPDGRVLFIIPRKDLGPGAEMVIIGTTDSPEKKAPEDVTADSHDVDYLLRILSGYFPDAHITQKDIVMTYAGVRPLLDEGESSEAKTSREHEIWRNAAGIVFMAGGKYTTFRKISQEIADFSFPGTSTKNHVSKELLSTPKDYQARLTGRPVWGRFTDEWIAWKCEHHCPLTLEDIVFRRLPLWMGGRDISPEVLDHVAKVVARYFDWDHARVENEKQKVWSGLKSGFEWLAQEKK